MRTTASGTSGSHALKGARNNLVQRFTESGGLDESNNNCPLLTEADSTPAGRVHVLKSLGLPPRTVNLPLLHLALMTHFKVAESKHASILNDAAQATLLSYFQRTKGKGKPGKGRGERAAPGPGSDTDRVQREADRLLQNFLAS